jgi:Outer membrane lipoprotein carrier protein LolA-like
LLAVAVSLTLTSLAAARDPTDLDGLLAALARPAPAEIAFRELRFTKLLTVPIRVAGHLEYRGQDRLARVVEWPWQERTDIDAGTVRIERPGEPARVFSLSRAPELEGLIGSFAAVLAGDRDRLERDFDAALTSDATGWHLDLTPRDAKLRRRLVTIRVSGQGTTPACFAFIEGDGDMSLVLLGAGASDQVDDADTAKHECRVADAAP